MKKSSNDLNLMSGHCTRWLSKRIWDKGGSKDRSSLKDEARPFHTGGIGFDLQS
jgi:hypothetical protein